MKHCFFIFVLCAQAFAACSGGSPTWTAATASATDVQACITAASVGDTINVPTGTASWGAGALTLKAGGNKFVGASTLSFAGSPGTSGYTPIAVDNTVITLTADQSVNATLTSGLTTFQNFTFVDGSGGAGHGLLDFNENFGMVGVRIAYNHFKMAISNSINLTVSGYGLIDHNFFEDTTPSGSGAIPINVYDYYPDNGYSAWNAATQMGTNQSLIMEANYYSTSHTNGEGLFDGYAGCRVTLRYNTIIGNLIGGCHGTDSGPYRSGMLVEMYQNYVLNALGAGLFSSRGGITLFWGNNIPTDGVGTPSVSLNYVRFGAQISSASNWGEAGTGLNWWLVTGPPASGWPGNPVTLNIANYQTSHTYAANAVAVDTAGGTCNLQTIAGGTTGNAQPACPGTFGGTVTDNGGVVWVNVGGNTTASGLSVHGWCTANPDTAAAADATCAALSGGDTASYYLDGPTPGTLPCGYRDQPGCGHNQVLTPDYEWLNTGAGLPSPVFSTTNSSIIINNVHYYDDTGACGSNVTTGICEATSPPASCTSGVAYWNSNVTTLYRCGPTNTWSVQYQPYTYPDPLQITFVPSGQIGNGAILKNGAIAQ